MQSPSPRWRVPDGRIVYAVGDIHGRLDLLDEMLERIANDARRFADFSKCLLFLGDYIDRGPSSRGVVEQLLGNPLPRFEKVFLLGNHEQVMLRYLGGDLRIACHWLQKGGIEALESYGIEVTEERMADEAALEALRLEMQRVIPSAHIRFLKNLRASHREGDYYFAHAGILPGVPLERQTVRDQIWIRARFHRSPLDHGVRVVHGHEVVPEVEVLPNRIGIDTGAYRTGILTCLTLHGDTVRFLQSIPEHAVSRR